MYLNEAPSTFNTVDHKSTLYLTSGGILTPIAYHEVPVSVYRQLLNWQNGSFR